MFARIAAAFHRRLRLIRTEHDAGFTMIEVVVSLVVFATVSGASVTAIATAIRTTNSTRDRVTASNLAEADLQAARALQYPDYPAAETAHTITVGNKTFTLQRTITTTCPSLWTPGQPTSMQVTASVTWPGSTSSVVVGTVIAC